MLSLFQNSVLRNHLQNTDHTEALQAYEVYKTDFLPKIENIKASKEEQYQYGFLDDLFVKVLGYTLNPTPDYNLIAEQKNLSNSKKADGAVLKEGKVIAVIELKSTKTKSMDKIVTQAFGYKHNHPTCKYIITSNFEKLRFYVEHSDKYEEFNLFELDEERFTLLYTLLNKESIFSDVPLTIKTQSKLQEENISNELYKKYATLRTNLFENIIQNNPSIDKHVLLEKTQTILDRMVFIFFGEDRGILPPNTIRAIVDHYEGDIEDRELWHFYKIYFNAINKGNTKLKIPEYNGGLFATDELLDSLIIDKEVLDASPLMLSAYDFNSDIDVNILGHIFENSLNDIEELKARIADADFDAKQSKRKKDGVFYTPEYITKYIVDNTLGTLCQTKKEELGLDDVEIEVPKNPKKLNKTQSKQKDALEAYRKYLLGLKILDPACGSGAFLNQALNYLLEEHAFIDEGIRTLMGGSVLGLYDVKKGILENNLYGVDINAEAVEIAKLSLWLRTVESGRKLNKLADKIKVGNSLIDDKAVADDAFVWEEEFAEVFEQGGFDVVIGNPPYGAKLDEKEWLKNRFKETSFGDINSYKFFIQKGIELLNKNKILAFIVPDSYLEKEYFQDVREYMVNNCGNLINIKLGDDVFDDVTMPTSIMILSEKGYKCNEFNFLDIAKYDTQEGLQNYNFIQDVPDYKKTFIIKKSIIKNINTKALIDVYEQVMGVKVYQKGKGKPKQTDYEKKNDVFVSIDKFEEYNYPYISQGIERYFYDNKNEYIKYGEWLAEPRKKVYFENEKIVIREIINPRIFATYIGEPAIIKNIAAVIISKNDDFSIKYLLALMNSKLFTFYVNEQSSKSSNKSYPSFNSRLIKNIPIKNISMYDQKPLIEKADKMLELNKTLQTKKQTFLKRVQDNLALEKLSKKLEAFYEHDFKTFVSELKKKKVTLTLKDQDEWEEYFTQYQTELLGIKADIDATDKQIDAMVYALYGLSEEEIAVVEGR